MTEDLSAYALRTADGPPEVLMRGDGPYRSLIESERRRLARAPARAA